MTDSSNSSTEGGNTKPPPKSSEKTLKKQDSARKNWCFTLNNYTEKEYEDILRFFRSDSSNIWIVGKETGDEGTPHLQMFCSFAKKIRFTALKKLSTRMHVEPCRGSKADNMKYCAKEGDYETNGRIPKELVKMTIDRMSGWQLKALEFFAEDEDPLDGRDIWWIWEPTGRRGKSQLATYLVDQKDWIILGGKAADMKYAVQQYCEVNGEGPPGIVIDCPRSMVEYLSFGGIEDIKNGCFFSGKYEGGTVRFNRPHVLIFANTEPELTKDGADVISLDRWKIREIVEDELRDPEAGQVNDYFDITLDGEAINGADPRVGIADTAGG
jgi:hypothetical protein